MAYQPLYATVTDVNGTRSSYSCRKKVNWIKIWLNSKLGEVLEVYSHFDEEKNKVIVDINLLNVDNIEVRANRYTLKKMAEQLNKVVMDEI